MRTTNQLRRQIEGGAFDEVFSGLYPSAAGQVRQRYLHALTAFEEQFGADRQAVLISAPGRTEVGGNHTDHQRGRVLAAAVNLDVICVASPREDSLIRVQSYGYPMDTVDIQALEPRKEESNYAASLIRGVAAWFRDHGLRIGGFDAYTTSDVLKGSGLSSSAAFEVAVGGMLSHLYNGGAVGAVEIAQAGQYAENVFFGKPSGLMDQTASSVGGFVEIDFEDPQNPVISRVPFRFADSGYCLCIVDTKGDHADLTPDYAAIPREMALVSGYFGKNFLREVDPDQFYSRIGDIRQRAGDRAVLRAMHFFDDNRRVPELAGSLRRGDFDRFLSLIIQSGDSSFALLQNGFSCADPQRQGVSLALALSRRLLAGKGAWRVHGGGFAGTIQAFVPKDDIRRYQSQMEAVFGRDSCHILSIRPAGCVRVAENLDIPV